MQSHMVHLYRYRATSGDKLHRTNQSSTLLGDSFNNGDNVRAAIQFKIERQTHHLKR